MAIAVLLLAVGAGVVMMRLGSGPETSPDVAQLADTIRASTAAPVPVIDVGPVAMPSPPVEKVAVVVPGDAPEPPRSGIVSGAEAAQPGPRPAPTTEPKRVESFQRLDGCLCRVELNDQPGLETVQLGVVVRGSGLTITGGGSRHEYTLAFALLPSQGDPILLATAIDSAPPSTLVGQRLGVGMVCDANRIAIASQSAVSAWSIQDGSLLWTTPLDGTYPRPSGDGVDLNIECAQLNPSKRAVRVPRERQSPLKVGLETGSIL